MARRSGEAPRTTTYGIVARDAPRVVIFRRGPTRYTRLLCWDLRDDTIRGGQWLIGNVDPGPCGVSPDGELLVYAARKGEQTFTAISRPPYFTALAFWRYSSPWTGGGFFSGDRKVVLGLGFEDPYAAGEFPSGFAITDAWTYFAAKKRIAGSLSSAARAAPEANHGWSTTESGIIHKPHPARPELTLERSRSARAARTYRVVDAAHAYDLGKVDWADWAHDGSLLLGYDGALYRQRLARTRWETAEEPSLVADLKGQSFEHVEPPAEALRWPGQTGRRSAASPRKGRGC